MKRRHIAGNLRRTSDTDVFLRAIRLETDGLKTRFLRGKTCIVEKKVKLYDKVDHACFSLVNFDELTMKFIAGHTE